VKWYSSLGLACRLTLSRVMLREPAAEASEVVLFEYAEIPEF
jgi:hypothetical protein